MLDFNTLKAWWSASGERSSQIREQTMVASFRGVTYGLARKKEWGRARPARTMFAMLGRFTLFLSFCSVSKLSNPWEGDGKGVPKTL